MDISVAEAIVRATREQAAAEARNDLRELSRRAVEAGRERSRRIIKTSRIDTRTGELRYNPAGRLLRDWYFHVYLNTLRRNLGEPAAAIDAQQVEDTTSLLRRLRPHTDPLACLRVIGTVRNTAVDDASHAAADIVDHLATVCARRAVLHAADNRFGDDTLATHITRHWYLHCYDNTIRSATSTQHPNTGVTRGQELDVADTLAAQEARRVVGQDGLPVSTKHAPSATDPEVRTLGQPALPAGEAPLAGDPRVVAAQMFNHQHPLDAPTPPTAEQPDSAAPDQAQTAHDLPQVESHLGRRATR